MDSSAEQAVEQPAKSEPAAAGDAARHQKRQKLSAAAVGQLSPAPPSSSQLSCTGRLRLAGKVAVITGAASGIGAAAAAKFVAEGAQVVLADIDVAAGEELAKRLNAAEGAAAAAAAERGGESSRGCREVGGAKDGDDGGGDLPLTSTLKGSSAAAAAAPIPAAAADPAAAPPAFAPAVAVSFEEEDGGRGMRSAAEVHEMREAMEERRATGGREPVEQRQQQQLEVVAAVVRCDVRSRADLQATFEAAETVFGGLDIVVNNAAVMNAKSLMETKEEEWYDVLETNLTSVFRSTQLAVPFLRRRGGGCIVNVSSSFAIVGSTGYAAYHAAKGGVSSLTRAAALSLIPDKIRVNAVCPGTILTPGLQQVAARDCGLKTPDEVMQGYLQKQPLGRYGTPEEVASAIAFCASEEASFLVGSSLVVDGGYTIV